jgi:hypothetical protein
MHFLLAIFIGILILVFWIALAAANLMFGFATLTNNPSDYWGWVQIAIGIFLAATASQSQPR